MNLLCLILVPLALAISLPLTWLLARVGGRLGAIDQPGAEAHKGHARAVPNTGGVAIFVAIAGPVLAALLCIRLLPDNALPSALAPLREHLPGLRWQSRLVVAILAALTVLHVMGLIDDRRRLSARLKLAVQLLVTTILAAMFGVRIFQFLEHFGRGGEIASIAISALWMTAIINAMNMLDNMDGLAGGVGAIIAGLYLAATLIGGQWFVAALCALLVGALLGFLIFNFPPARIFMGDGGSMVLGLLLAIISVRTTYVPIEIAPASTAALFRGQWHVMLMPLVLLAVPLYDLVSVSLIRLSQGRSPFVGDQQHFSHRLVRRGFTKRDAVLVIWLATLATGLGGIMFPMLESWQAVLIAVQAVAVLAVLAVLER